MELVPIDREPRCEPGYHLIMGTDFVSMRNLKNNLLNKLHADVVIYKPISVHYV